MILDLVFPNGYNTELWIHVAKKNWFCWLQFDYTAQKNKVKNIIKTQNWLHISQKQCAKSVQKSVYDRNSLEH